VDRTGPGRAGSERSGVLRERGAPGGDYFQSRISRPTIVPKL
jgi:hypothetical protein